MSKADVFNWVKIFLPIILSAIPATRQVAGPVTEAAKEAEKLFGPGSGAEKQAYAVNVGKAVGDTINTINPGKIDTDNLTSAIESGIDTAFAIAKLAAKTSTAPEDK